LATAALNNQKALPITRPEAAAGYVAPYIGRIAQRDVVGIFGITLIHAGEVITDTIADRAQRMGRLYELIAASDAPPS
jgi:hypothetical protein